MKLVSVAKDVTPITARGGEIHVLISPKTAGSQNMIMGAATVPVGGTVKAHVHDYSEECFYVLRGYGRVHLEGMADPIEFYPGAAVRIPQAMIHSIENTGSEEIMVVFASAPLAPSASVGHRNIGETSR